jgi:hypothetical protein
MSGALRQEGRPPLLLLCALTLALCPAAASAQALPPGAWDVTSTVVEFAMPGVPGFVARMIRGRSKSEHKRLATDQGVEALLAPDPKARCHIDSQHIGGGQYTQALTCPQKQGEPMHIARAGTYDAAGFAGRATVAGTTPKGPLHIVLDQRAARTGR